MSKISKAEVALLLASSALKLNVEDYCDLETTTGQTSIVTNKGALLSFIKYEGTKTMVSISDLEKFAGDVIAKISNFFEEKGHHIAVIFKRDNNPTSQIFNIAEIKKETLRNLNLKMDFLVDEDTNTYANNVCDEVCYFVLYTEPMRLDATEKEQEKQKKIEDLRGFEIPSMRDAQGLLTVIESLKSQHETFVDQFLKAITNVEFSAQAYLLNVVDSLNAIKRCVAPNTTPFEWEPEVPVSSMRLTPRWKEGGPSDDISSVIYRPIPEQLLSQGIFDGFARSHTYPVGSIITDDVIFAPLMIDIPPSSDVIFKQLFDDLNSTTVVDENGEERVIPYTISWHLTGDGLAGTGFKTQLAQVLTFASSGNENMKEAAKALKQYEADGGLPVKLQMSVMTWAMNSEDGLKTLVTRRQKLSRILQSWGSAKIMEQGGDPILSWRSNIPGLSIKHHAPACPAKFYDAVLLLPWTRQASPFEQGTVLHRTVDGKLIALEKFSSNQTTWITIYCGKPGSGKSVAMNNDIIEACMMPGIKRLPLISIIDVGVSSRGPIELLRDHLPKEQEHLATYARMRNTEEFAINVLECSVGFNFPMQSEIESMTTFITSLVTPVESEGKPEEGMNNFVDRVIRKAFELRQDGTTTGSPNRYRLNSNLELDAILKKYQIIDPNILLSSSEIIPSYFNLRDKCHLLGEQSSGIEQQELYRARDLCHRYAMPALPDLNTAASANDIAKAYADARTSRGELLISYFTRNISEAVSMFPAFASHTRFDVSTARVVSIDLQDVINGANTKQVSLFFQIATIFSQRKIAYAKEDLPQVPSAYKQFYSRKIEELAEDRKIIAMDELHNAKSDKLLFLQLTKKCREARKWGIEICLASQLIDDFAELTSFATRYVIADGGTNETRTVMREKLSLKPVEERALAQNVGLSSAGLTYLSKFVCKSGGYTSLLTLTIGPQRLWALTTDSDDRLMRDTMYTMTGDDRPLALKLLAEAFPGLAKKEIHSRRLKLRHRATIEMDDNFNEEQASKNIVAEMANEVMDSYMARMRRENELRNKTYEVDENRMTARDIADMHLAQIHEKRSRIEKATLRK